MAKTSIVDRPHFRGYRNVVYLIHFETPLHHARHYLGSAQDLNVRLEKHARGNGARLMAVIKKRGIAWRLARVWGNFGGIWAARKFESHIKRHRKNSRKLCPICRGEAV